MLEPLGSSMSSAPEHLRIGVTSRRVGAALRRIGDRPVTVNINSPGGSYDEGVAIYNLLRTHGQKVSIRVLGLAASAASVIAMAGDEVLIGEGASLMVHNSYAIGVGNAGKLESLASALRGFDGAMARLYAARAGVDQTVAAAWMEAETYFVGEDAVSAGLADGMLSAPVKADDRVEASALRRVESALALQGISRSERRSLLRALRGTPSAATEHHVTPSADDPTETALADLLTSIKQRRRV